MLALLVEIRLEDIGHGTRFAPLPRDPFACRGTCPKVREMTTRRLSVTRRFLPALAALALVGLVLAGCGGSGKAGAAAGAAGTDGRAAQAFPPSTVAFLDANIDESSTAWKQMLALGARFPAWPKVVAEFEKSLASGAKAGDPTLGEIRAWLGAEAAIGVLDVPADGSDPSFLAFADVRDRNAVEASFKKEKHTEAAGTHGGFDLLKDTTNGSFAAVSADTLLIGSTQAIVEAGIDRLAGTGDRLSSLSTFQDTLATLPADNLVVGYAPGSVLKQLVALGRKNDPTKRSSGISQAQFDKLAAKLDGVRSLGMSLGATDKGVRLRGTALLSGAESVLPAAYVPTLLDRVPANSWFAASFGDIGSSARSAADQVLSSNPDAQKQVTQVEALLGIKLDDVYALISGEHALYAGPGAPLSAGLILHPEDTARGATTLKALTRLLTQQGIKFQDTADGQSAVIQGFAARWRAVDDVLAIGTDAAVGNATKDSIVDAEKFKRVLADDGVDSGAKTLGLAYVDVPSLVNLGSAFGTFNGAGEKDVLDNLRHIGGVLYWTGLNGGTLTSDLFVEST
jgi:hypothetical protein